MPDAAGHAFAERMRAKPIPESMLGGAAARHFYDPSEIVQIAFGGREWFFDRDCRTVHRIGLMAGLAWKLPPTLHRTHDNGGTINGVRIVARGLRSDSQKFDLFFVEYRRGEDNLDLPVYQTVTHRPGLTADQLKPAYAEMLGEDSI